MDENRQKMSETWQKMWNPMPVEREMGPIETT